MNVITKMEPSDEEKNPLLRSEITKFKEPRKDDDVNCQTPYTLRYSVGLTLSLGLCALVQLFSYTVSGLLFIQYAYVALPKIYFPEVPANETSVDRSDCALNETSDAYVYQIKIQELTSQLSMYVTVCFSIPAMAANIFFGSYSDTYGRKKYIVCCLTGSFLKCVLYSFGTYFEINIYFFILFGFVEGCFGMFTATASLSFAYIADITHRKQRVIYIALYQSMIGLGVVSGSVSSGYLIQSTGFVFPNILTSLFLAICIILLIIFLPESRIKYRSVQEIRVVEKLKSVVQFYVRDPAIDNRLRWKFIIMGLIVFISGSINHGRTTVETLYQLNAPFCWDSVLIGWYLAIRMTCQLLIMVAILKFLRLLLADELIGILGEVSCAVSLIVEAMTTEDIVLLLVPVIGFGTILAEPIVRGLMSKMAPPDKQGALFAGIGLSESLCTLIGVLVFNNIYTATVGINVGIVFYCLAALAVVVIILFILLIISNRLYPVIEKHTDDVIIVDNDEEDNTGVIKS